MKIVLNPKKKMKRGELIILYHPRNKDLATLMKKIVETRTGEIEVRDDRFNRFIIPLLNIYYFEVVEQKVFVYTKSEVYRLSMTFHDVKEMVINKGFVQINVRTMVNERHIIRYKMMKGCHRMLIMDNGETLESTRLFKENVNDMVRRKKIKEIIEIKNKNIK